MKNLILFWMMIILMIHNKAWAQMDKLPARTIIDKSQELSKVEEMESVSILKIVDQRGRERVRKLATASMSDGGINKTIMKFLEPADVKGTGILIFDYEERPDDMWIYMPALRKTRRIVAREKSQNFMGSEFTNADMTVPTLDDFTISKAGTEIIDGIQCMKISMIPKDQKITKEYGFYEKVAYVGLKDYLIRQVDYYNEDETKSKVLYFEKYRALDENKEQYIADEMRIENLENGRKSIMLMEQVQLNTQLEAGMFTTSYLEK